MSIDHSPGDFPQALEARYYTDPDIQEAQRQALFAKSWTYVCHASQISAPGSYLSFQAMGHDLFVVRGKDDEVRCFYNVCQHRAHTLVEGTGHTQFLVCPYHAWSYALDGRLKAAPNARNVPGFNREAICLTGIRCEVFLGFVFINFDPDAASMDTHYPGVREAVLEMVPDIERLQFAHVHSAHEYCNWLAATENYNECYHCGHVHKAFSSGVIEPASYNILPFGEGRVLRHTSEAAAGDGSWYENGGSAYSSFYLFPLFSLQIYPGQVVNTYHWQPNGHDDTIVYRSWFSADGAVDTTLQSIIDLDRDTTFAEDLRLVKEVQRGLSSPGYRPGPLIVSPQFGIDSEHSIATLHQWVRETSHE